MLSRKLAALALIVFASQGTMAAPASPPSSVSDTALIITGEALGGTAAAIFPPELVNAAIQADKGEAPPPNDHRGGPVGDLLIAGSSASGSIGRVVFPEEELAAGNKAAEDYYKSHPTP